VLVRAFRVFRGRQFLFFTSETLPVHDTNHSPCQAMRIRSCISLALAALIPTAARAQFYSYPSFEIPRIALREYNFAVADGKDGGTSLLFQWREGMNDRMHLQLDAGLADPNSPRSDARLIVGGSFASQIRQATDDLPLDMQFTAGIGGNFGGGTSFLRIPVGLSVGHRFALDAPFAVTPYAHPRLSVDFCSRCAGGSHDTTLGVDVDLGVSGELSSSLALRASLLFAGSDFYGRGNAFGFSLAWTPRHLN
jgi:hypothetical protein